MTPESQALNDIEKNDLAAQQLGRKPFWQRTYHIGKDYRGAECDAEILAYRLMKNKEGHEIRLENRGLRNGRPVIMQNIHLNESDLKGILAMFGEIEDGS